MFKKALLGGVVIAAALGGPAGLFWAAKYWNELRQAFVAATDKNGKTRAESAAFDPASNVPSANINANIAGAIAKTPTDLAPRHDLVEVLRFDVTPGWIMQQWPRVSTGLSKPHLEGYRVPLLTGAGASDLAGSLTYYFDNRQQVREITFRGTTGEPGNLLQVLTTRYKFARKVTNDPGLIIYETVDSAGKSTSSAKIRSASVLKANEPLKRFEIELDLNRPQA
jgi:hypothetical protein